MEEGSCDIHIRCLPLKDLDGTEGKESVTVIFRVRTQYSLPYKVSEIQKASILIHGHHAGSERIFSHMSPVFQKSPSFEFSSCIILSLSAVNESLFRLL